LPAGPTVKCSLDAPRHPEASILFSVVLKLNLTTNLYSAIKSEDADTPNLMALHKNNLQFSLSSYFLYHFALLNNRHIAMQIS